MKLEKLLRDVKVLYVDDYKKVDIKDICISTKEVKEGSLFICLKGQNYNGHNFKQEAKSKGAVAFLVEEYDENFDGVQILVPNTRTALSFVARNFFWFKKKLNIIGITGTNGKTTTSFMLAGILKAAGKNVGVIGTEGIYFNGKKIVLNMTTPDPIDLFKYLKQMADDGVDYVVMEVSAHAIYLNKINALKFYAKALTNITEDHLDFFKDMQQYAQTKVGFIEKDDCIKVVNKDDEMASFIAEKNKNIYTFGMDETADVFAYGTSRDFSKYSVSLFDRQTEISTQTMGRYNVENALCAMTLAKLMGIQTKHILLAMENFESVAGRMNIYKKEDKKVIIDFAHTPDAISKLLTTVREFTKNKLICLFGCGGNRDPNKREIMGDIATNLADMVYITNDNPRNEEPSSIAKMIEKGIKGGTYEIILDRKEAIQKAISIMQDGDILCILGKGAENYMDIKGKKYPYSDKEEVLKYGFK